jgi:hypothetical protein
LDLLDQNHLLRLQQMLLLKKLKVNHYFQLPLVEKALLDLLLLLL